jgi:hypothetical protein
MSVPVIGSPEGFTPFSGTPSMPATTVWQQNTNPYDVVVYLDTTGVTHTHIYVNSAANGNTTTGAVDLHGVNQTVGSMTIIVPAGGWIRLDYSAGTPVWTWQGGI